MTKRVSENEPDLSMILHKKSKNSPLVPQPGEQECKTISESTAPPQQKISSLKSPIMLLTGHDGEIFSTKFHPNGKTLASAGSDRSIYLWNVHDKCENYAILKAVHSNTILDLAYSSDGDKIFSCSADKTIIVWDTETGGRIRKLKAHSSIVNAIGTTNSDCNLLTSVGDDRQINIWDIRKRNYVHSFKDTYQLTSVTFNKNVDQVISGGIENIIKVWDIRKNELAYPMPCHSDTVTGLSLSPDGRSIVSNSIDNTIRIWDVRPLAPRGRLLATLTGHQHNFEKNLLRCSWSPDGNFVTGGSADRMVYIWNVAKRQVVYRLPGHRGSVNEVVFHPFEPIVLSCSSDKQLYMGELVLSND